MNNPELLVAVGTSLKLIDVSIVAPGVIFDNNVFPPCVDTSGASISHPVPTISLFNSLSIVKGIQFPLTSSNATFQTYSGSLLVPLETIG